MQTLIVTLLYSPCHSESDSGQLLPDLPSISTIKKAIKVCFSCLMMTFVIHVIGNSPNDRRELS